MVTESLSERNEEYGLARSSWRFDIASSLPATEECGRVVDDALLVAVEYVALLAVGDVALEIAKVPFTM